MPRWGLMNVYADFMNGEPGLQVFADAFCRGLVPDDALEPLARARSASRSCRHRTAIRTT